MLDMLEDLREIDRMAQWCVSRNLAWVNDPREALDEARSAILEKVAESAAGAEVTKQDLVVAGKQAIRRMVKADNKGDGVNATTYWTPAASDPMDERIIERIALDEVFSSLSDDGQELLLTFVAHGDSHAAAEHMGITPIALMKRLRLVRESFFRKWFDWEVAPTLPPLPRTRAELATHCGRGHEFTPESTGYRRGKNTTARKVRYCRACVKHNQAQLAERKRAAAAAETEGIAS